MKSLEFVRTEFFKLNRSTFEHFANFYSRKYGSGAEEYLRRTYPRWRSGSTQMSGQTQRRILACVPPFLNTSRQFELLSFQIAAVIDQQRSELRVREIRTSELESSYRSFAARIAQRDYKLDWFVNEVFAPQEITEFLNVFKYTMLDCLRQSYSQVREDITMFHDIHPKLDASIDISYHIAFLDCSLQVDVYPPGGAPTLDVPMTEPRLITQFQQGYKGILLDHALLQCRTETVGRANRQVALADIEAIVAQLQRTKSDQEYDSTLQIQGHGGTLHVRLQKKNVLRLQYAMAKETAKLLTALSISGVVITWICIRGLWPILFYAGIIILGIVGSIWKRLKELRLEVTEYERKRAARFTAS